MVISVISMMVMTIRTNMLAILMISMIIMITCWPRVVQVSVVDSTVVNTQCHVRYGQVGSLSPLSWYGARRRSRYFSNRHRNTEEYERGGPECNDRMTVCGTKAALT